MYYLWEEKKETKKWFYCDQASNCWNEQDVFILYFLIIWIFNFILFSFKYYVNFTQSSFLSFMYHIFLNLCYVILSFHRIIYEFLFRLGCFYYVKKKGKSYWWFDLFGSIGCDFHQQMFIRLQISRKYFIRFNFE